jgi:hypothetical protein
MALAELPKQQSRFEPGSGLESGQRIVDRLEQVRRSVVRTRRWTRGLLAVSVGLLLWAILSGIDYFGEIPSTVRAVGLLVAAALTVLAIRRGLPGWGGTYRLSHAASDAEARLDGLGQRLRTTLDYRLAETRTSPAEPALVQALEADTLAVSERTDFNVVVDSRALLAGIAVAGLATVAWIVALLSSSEWRVAAGRAMLLPWQYTQVTYTPVEVTVKVGASVKIVAEISGRPINEARVQYRQAGTEDAWRELAFDNADEAPQRLLGKVEVTLDDCQRDIEFQVRAGPLPLPPGHVRVLQPLELIALHAIATPPAYTRRNVEEFSDWSFKVLEGADVQLRVELSRAAAEARLVPIRVAADHAPPGDGNERDPRNDARAESPSDLPLNTDGNFLLASLSDLRASGVWELRARTDDGVELDPRRLSIRVQLDGQARIRFLEPSDELELIPTAEVPLLVEAADDQSLIRIGIAAQVADGPMQTIWEQNIDEGTTDTVHGRFTLALEEFELTFQDGITYYAFADDQYFDQQRRAVTPLRFIDIRPFKLAYQMLDTGGT